MRRISVRALSIIGQPFSSLGQSPHPTITASSAFAPFDFTRLSDNPLPIAYFAVETNCSNSSATDEFYRLVETSNKSRAAMRKLEAREFPTQDGKRRHRNNEDQPVASQYLGNAVAESKYTSLFTYTSRVAYYNNRDLSD